MAKTVKSYFWKCKSAYISTTWLPMGKLWLKDQIIFSDEPPDHRKLWRKLRLTKELKKWLRI